MFNGYDDYPSYGMGGFVSNSRGFNEQYRCYSVVMMQGNERQNVNHGGKIILPQSALAKLGDLVTVKSAKLELGSFVKIQPQSVDFLDISDPKAVLENALRNFSTLTVGDNIEISYNDTIYGILVMEIKPPEVGISIVETDLEVDFAPPVGYQEPTPTPRGRPVIESKLRKEVEKRIATPDSAKRVPFEGQGQSLSSKGKSAAKNAGKMFPSKADSDAAADKDVDLLDKNGTEAPAALNLPLGNLYFGYKYIPPKTEEDKLKEMEKAKEPTFEGVGQTLRPPRKNATRGSGATSPSPSVSSATSVSRVPTPAVQPPSSSESKPDSPFQGKGYSMQS
ncbi:ubiquitin fusion degradation protein [Mortierella sp. GBA43]|nr:ubiquitin fusion degradation protein [Mortierella sp. GBA43]